MLLVGAALIRDWSYRALVRVKLGARIKPKLQWRLSKDEENPNAISVYQSKCII